jgi:trk system potassium uptake protein TrkH
MDWFNALCHALSTLGTGGFSTRNDSLAAFCNPAAEWVCTAFMFAAAVNFAIYHRLLVRRDPDALRGTEFRAFCGLAAGATVAIFAVLLATGAAPFWRALRLAAFQVASLVSTTGFSSDNYEAWAPAAKAVLLLLCFTGGSSGSTAGGPKLIRWAALAKQTGCELGRVLHPRAVFTARIDGQPVRDGLLATVGAFIFAYLALVAATAIAGAIAGLPVLEAFTAGLSMVGNIGPAFGSLGPTASCCAIAAPLKLFYAFAMLAGRLEIYTLLILAGRVSMPHRTQSGADRA